MPRRHTVIITRLFIGCNICNVSELHYAGVITDPESAVAALLARPWGQYGLHANQAGVTVEVHHVRRRDVRRMQAGRARGWPWWVREPAFSFVI